MLQLGFAVSLRFMSILYLLLLHNDALMITTLDSITSVSSSTARGQKVMLNGFRNHNFCRDF